MSDDFWIKLGWLLFVTSAIFFIIAAWRAGDMMALIGAVVFLAANIAFMIPIYRGRD
jgi:predicted membrane channel-forming protein YqfA (hemolysin III family)